MQQATFLEYNWDGFWQSEKKVTLRRLGLSRTFLRQGQEYKCVNCKTELGHDRRVKLATNLWRRHQGNVCIQYEYDDVKSPSVLLELAVKAGAIAFVATETFQLPENVIHPIPIYALQGEQYRSTNNILRLDVQSNETTASSTFSEWATSKGIADAVVQNLELCGVKTVEDAAFLYVDERDRSHKKMLAADAEQDKAQRVIFPSNFMLKDIGVGGLGKDFEVVFRRLFASRMFSASKLAMLGISHCKGLLLCGPPGCGKTRLARQLSKLLKTCSTKIISGPEVFNKWMGQSEANVRDLFKDAEAEWEKKGDKSGLHVVIIDEIDAMCGKRSDIGDSTGDRVRNSVVNQLLAKMDGVEQINNILLIGMTNRKEAIDLSLLRPGRFELHLEIGLPDEAGRREILDIHTQKMREGCLLDEATYACLSEIAMATENFSGAEIESIVKGACSIAMDRCLDSTDFSLLPDETQLKLRPDDFYQALKVVMQTMKK